MTVFEAFPEAMTTWTWLAIKRGTEVGTSMTELRPVNVIETEADKATLHNTPKADGVVADILLYVRPGDMPETQPSKLMANYGLQSDFLEQYDIIDVAIAKNQDSSKIEHYELSLKLTSME